MDAEGFEAITQAFVSADVKATVTPKPAEGEDVRFITVETNENVQPAQVLNALGNAGLTHCDGLRDAAISYTPELSPLGVQPGSLTFEDRNDANRHMWG